MTTQSFSTLSSFSPEANWPHPCTSPEFQGRVEWTKSFISTEGNLSTDGPDCFHVHFANRPKWRICEIYSLHLILNVAWAFYVAIFTDEPLQEKREMIISLENKLKGKYQKKEKEERDTEKKITKMDLDFQGGWLTCSHSLDIYLYGVLHMLSDWLLTTNLDVCRTSGIMISLLHMENLGLRKFVCFVRVLWHFGRSLEAFTLFMSVVLKVWFLDQRHHPHLRTCQRLKFSGPLHDLLTQKLGGWGLSSFCFNKPCKEFSAQHVWEPDSRVCTDTELDDSPQPLLSGTFQASRWSKMHGTDVSGRLWHPCKRNASGDFSDSEEG